MQLSASVYGSTIFHIVYTNVQHSAHRLFCTLRKQQNGTIVDNYGYIVKRIIKFIDTFSIHWWLKFYASIVGRWSMDWWLDGWFVSSIHRQPWTVCYVANVRWQIYKLMSRKTVAPTILLVLRMQIPFFFCTSLSESTVKLMTNKTNTEKTGQVEEEHSATQWLSQSITLSFICAPLPLFSFIIIMILLSAKGCDSDSWCLLDIYEKVRNSMEHGRKATANAYNTSLSHSMETEPDTTTHRTYWFLLVIHGTRLADDNLAALCACVNKSDYHP